jgi:ribosomal protein S18 acetylase RimI-like enzyme
VSRHPAAADFNRFFHGAVFGDYDIFSVRSYADFARRNDIDLAAAVTRTAGGKVIGALAFGVRRHRAWFGLIGVDPKHRREGVARAMMTEAIEAVHQRAVTQIELEISQRNAPTLAFVREFGFEQRGELLVWARRALAGNAQPLPTRPLRDRTIAKIARVPPACWQREPRSVALATRLAHVDVPGAYAFVRGDGDFANVLDAGAADAVSAAALLRALDTHVPQDLTLNNEPAGSPLSCALGDAGWRVVERQYQMVHTL